MSLHEVLDDIAQRIGPLARAQDVIHEVLEPGIWPVGELVPDQAEHHLAHRQHIAPQLGQVLPDRICLGRELRPRTALSKQLVFKIFEITVDELNRLKVAIHDVVKQDVDKDTDVIGAAGGELPVCIGHDARNIDVLIEPHRHQAMIE